jgi:hypothetical protein
VQVHATIQHAAGAGIQAARTCSKDRRCPVDNVCTGGVCCPKDSACGGICCIAFNERLVEGKSVRASMCTVAPFLKGVSHCCLTSGTYIKGGKKLCCAPGQVQSGDWYEGTFGDKCVAHQ